MPTIQADGCPIHVEVDGAERAPVLMLSNSLGTDLSMWDDQVGAFTKQFRLVRYDRRGHGQSGVPEGPYTMERLGQGRVGHPGPVRGVRGDPRRAFAGGLARRGPPRPSPAARR